jgi:hypothetical protein
MCRLRRQRALERFKQRFESERERSKNADVESVLSVPDVDPETGLPLRVAKGVPWAHQLAYLRFVEQAGTGAPPGGERQVQSAH